MIETKSLALALQVAELKKLIADTPLLKQTVDDLKRIIEQRDQEIKKLNEKVLTLRDSLNVRRGGFDA